MSLLIGEKLVKVYATGWARRTGVAGAGAGRRPGAEAVPAVDGVSLAVDRGETFALVGESGCGKTTVARMVMGLVRPTSGRVLVGGTDTSRLRGTGLLALRRQIQMVFQDPGTALDPRQRAGEAIEEPLVLHGLGSPAGRRREVGRLLELVGLGERERRCYPHQLSGGQKQRVLIARALALGPRLLVLDEPVSALDVSVRAQILNLLLDLQRELGLGYLFISHDLAVVRRMAGRVAVMHGGRIVEEGPVGAVWSSPAHPYTRALLGAVPVPDPRARPRPPDGPPAEPVADRQAILRNACLYAPFCPQAGRLCRRRRPDLAPAGPGLVPGLAAESHRVACHLI